MKLRSSFLFLAVALLPTLGQAQVDLIEDADTSYKHSYDVQLNLVGAFTGNYSMYVGWNLSPNNAIGVNGGFLSQAGVYDRLREHFHISPEYRFFLSSNYSQARGFFIAPYVKYSQGYDNNRIHTFISSTNDTSLINYNLNYQRVSIGANVGLVNIPYGKFVFSAWAGFGAHIVRNEDYSIDTEQYVLKEEFDDVYDARLEIGVGYRF